MHRQTIYLLTALLLLGCAATQEDHFTKRPAIDVIVKSSDGTRVEVCEKQTVLKTMEMPNQQGHLSQLSFIAGGQVFMKIFAGLSISDVTRLWNDFCVLEENTHIRSVNLFLNSTGGDAFAGLALADQIERAQRKGFRITAHASGIVASAAVPVFAVCDVRLAAAGTIFMVHEAALWKWPGRETASDIRSQNELMHLLRDRYIGKMIQNSNLSKAKWEELENKTTWFSAETARKWGLVDEIE